MPTYRELVFLALRKKVPKTISIELESLLENDLGLDVAEIEGIGDELEEETGFFPDLSDVETVQDILNALTEASEEFEEEFDDEEEEVDEFDEDLNDDFEIEETGDFDE